MAVNIGDDNEAARRVHRAVALADQHYTKPDALKGIDHNYQVDTWIGENPDVRVTHVFTLQLVFREMINLEVVKAAHDETLLQICGINVVKVHMAAAEIFKDVKLPRKP